MNAPARNFEATDGKSGGQPLWMGIMSPSGGGKTLSALRVATGMQEVVGGDIYGIDTENKRMLHYADKFKFKHVPFSPPFGSLDYLEALRWCNRKGARVIIIDSASHEHIGQGGYLETAEAVVDRIAGDDYKRREKAAMAGWAKAGPLRQKLIEGIKQLDGCFIFCFRAKERVKPMKINGKTEIVEQGFMPIGADDLVYEMAVNCMLPPRANGVPLWRSDHVGERLMMKLPNYLAHAFEDNKPLDEETGRLLARWASGGSQAPAASGRAEASGGRSAGLAPEADGTTWQEYVERWDVMLAEAKTAEAGKQLADTWKSQGHKDVRNSIEWPEDGTFEDLKKRVTDKIKELAR